MINILMIIWLKLLKNLVDQLTLLGEDFRTNFVKRITIQTWADKNQFKTC